MTETTEGLIVKIGADTAPLQKSLKDMGRLSAQFGRSLTSAFSNAAIRGRNLSDVLRTLALSLSKMALKAAFKPLEKAVGSFFSSAVSSFTGFAKGGVINARMPVPFAQGGVINSPITFPFGSRQLGLAGEAGPEAILPLARGQDGRLGVKSAAPAPVNITFNVSTPDAESFRRSESQISAMLNRAVSRGSRNL